MTKKQETQKQWFDKVSSGRSMRSIADALGMSSGNLSRWINADALTAEKIIAISLELNVNPVQALVDNAILPKESAPRSMTRTELVERIERLIAQLKKEIQAEETATIHQLHPNVRPAPYAADSSETEPEEGDDGYNNGP